jgi:hypothetical protein
VVDQASGARASGSNPNTQILSHLDYLGYRQEIPGESQFRDDGQFLPQSILCLPLFGRTQVPMWDLLLAPLSQQSLCTFHLIVIARSTTGFEQQIKFGYEDLTDPQIRRTDDAGFS